MTLLSRSLLLTSAVMLSASLASADLSAQNAFRPQAFRWFSISPSGEWIVGSANADGVAGLLVQHRSTGTKAQMLLNAAETGLRWAGGSVAVVGARSDGYGETILRFHLMDGEIEVKKNHLLGRGGIEEALPDEEEVVLWSRYLKGKTEVDRLSISELRNRSISFSKLKTKRIATLDRQAASWVIDSQGNLRAVLGYTADEATLLYRESNEAKWIELQHMSRGENYADFDQLVIPVGMAADGKNLIVVAYNGRSTRGIYEYNIETRSIDRALYHNPEHDIEDVTRDYSRVRILSAAYRRGGVLRHHYFEDPVESRRAELQNAFPQKSVWITSTSSDGAYAIVFVSGAQDPGHFYYLNMRLGTRVELASAAPWIKESDTSPVEALRVTTQDGFEIEAFLTLPSHSCDAKPPLVVLPHGGPIGVQDVKEFNPLVQFLAASGLAVLQVNYRGSAGYGRDFERAGKREQGAGIEDDIDAALAAVLTDDRVDAGRLCIAGGSYGGYSALMSVLRWPDRYRCAASIAGVVDLPLQYDSADFTGHEEGRKFFLEYQGDPETEYEFLKSISPLYRASEFSIPLLIVHGTEDRRVDVEHGYRMHLVLKKLGKLHTWHPISGAKHNLSDDEWRGLARLLRKFLTSHLKPSIPRTSSVMGELGCTTAGRTEP